jgi:hypothetical protein
MAKPPNRKEHSQTDDSGFTVPLGKANLAPTDQLSKAEAENGTPHSKISSPSCCHGKLHFVHSNSFSCGCFDQKPFVSLVKGVYL